MRRMALKRWRMNAGVALTLVAIGQRKSLVLVGAVRSDATSWTPLVGRKRAASKLANSLVFAK